MYFLLSTACGNAAIDTVFVIDGSKSVRPENFELVKKWINQIIDKLDVSDKNTHVGLVQYSSTVRTVSFSFYSRCCHNKPLISLSFRDSAVVNTQEFPLGRYNNKKDLKEAVKKMDYMERGTMTGMALRHMVDSVFNIAQGARPGVQKVAIVFTDGRSQDYIGDAAKKAKELGKMEKKEIYLI